MRTKAVVFSLLLLGQVSLHGVAAAADAVDQSQLASKSGCYICHGIELDAKGPHGLKPVGPPFKAIATRYANDGAAVSKLTQAVMGGTSPYQRHWQAEASGMAMPPNGIVIAEADAKKIVEWILTLK